jgi:hypothetical protein
VFRYDSKEFPMKTTHFTALMALLITASGAWAQGGPPASGPQRGMGPRAMSGADFTPGWAMMSRQERDEHRAKMRSMQNYDECKAYVEQHREQMAARAKERGMAAMPGPRRDACVGLKR